MTPQLQAALERLKTALLDYRDGDVYGAVDRRNRAREEIESALLSGGAVEGKWEAVEGDGDWWVARPDREYVMLDAPDQRTAEAYRDALNAADAALEPR